MSQTTKRQAGRLQARVDLKSNWETKNPQLLDREIGYERETGRYKIGDGNHLWMELDYAVGGKNDLFSTDEDNNVWFTNDIYIGDIEQKIGEPLVTINHSHNLVVSNVLQPISLPSVTTIIQGNGEITDNIFDVNNSTSYDCLAEINYKGYVELSVKGITTQPLQDIDRFPARIYLNIYYNNQQIDGFEIYDNNSQNTFNFAGEIDKIRLYGYFGNIEFSHFVGTQNIKDISGFMSIKDKRKLDSIYTDLNNNIGFGNIKSSKLYSSNTFSAGANNIAGGKAFKIIEQPNSWDATDGTYILDSVEGIEVGMTYSAVTSSAAYHQGTINKIYPESNQVVVTNYVDYKLNTAKDDPNKYNIYNFFMIDGHPELGTTEIGFNATAFGQGNIAHNVASFAEGKNNIALGKFSHAEGLGNIAGHAAHVEGLSSQALGGASHAEGQSTQATATGAHAEGYTTFATAKGAHAEGVSARAYGEASHAEGTSTLAQVKNSHAEGYSTSATGNGAHAEGYDTNSNGQGSHAEGISTKTTNEGAHAEGDSTEASGYAAHTEGYFTEATGMYSHAEGAYTKTFQQASHAEGNVTKANGVGAHGEGYYTIANGDGSHTEGYYTETVHYKGGQGEDVSSSGAHAEGYYTKATKKGAHAEGYGTETNKVVADGSGAHAEGCYTKAVGDGTHTEGCYTEVAYYKGGSGENVSSNGAHAEGYYTTASRKGAHAEGYGELGSRGLVKADGFGAHAEGCYTQATNDGAHAEGYLTRTSGRAAHAEGYGTTATVEAQHVQGKYNEAGNYAHIVGGGSSDTDRKNIHTVDWQGNAWFASNVYVGGTEQNEGAQLVTKDYVDNNFSTMKYTRLISPKAYIIFYYENNTTNKQNVFIYGTSINKTRPKQHRVGIQINRTAFPDEIYCKYIYKDSNSDTNTEFTTSLDNEPLYMEHLYVMNDSDALMRIIYARDAECTEDIIAEARIYPLALGLDGNITCSCNGIYSNIGDSVITTITFE